MLSWIHIFCLGKINSCKNFWELEIPNNLDIFLHSITKLGMLCFYIMRNRSIHERLIRYWYITLFSGNWIVLFCVDVHHSTTCIQYEDSIYLMPTYMIYHLSNLEKKYTFMILENYIAFIRKSSQTPLFTKWV